MKNNTWASYQIRKIAGCACAGNVGIVFPHPRFQRKPLVSDPDMHHGTCVTHVPWCMSGSLTCGDGENVPGTPGACAPAILRIWQEAHALIFTTQANFTYIHGSEYNLAINPNSDKSKASINNRRVNREIITLMWQLHCYILLRRWWSNENEWISKCMS